MRAEARSWDDWSTHNAPPILEEEKWHVALAPGEVKVVSLEQLDDLFRLSIVDAETKVWQDGMTEWQPLRVIAGIDDEPAAPAPPKRTHPKPPSPRSAPPPPRPATSASVYAAPISLAPAPISFVAPVTAQNSVRPLVVSRPPMAPARGGGFGRFLVGLAVVAGVSVSLYRNDVIREAAHSAHQDALYGRLEAALGGPAFGTLRSVEQSAPEQPAALAVDGSSIAQHGKSPTPEALLSTPSAAAAPSTAAALPHAAAAAAPPPVVSLESLTPEKKGAGPSTAPVGAALMAPVARAAQPVAQRAEAPVAQKAMARAEAQPKPVKAEKAAPPPPQKSEANMTEREKLNAAIGRSMLGAPVKASKAKGSEYDPLNPKL